MTACRGRRLGTHSGIEHALAGQTAESYKSLALPSTIAAISVYLVGSVNSQSQPQSCCVYFLSQLYNIIPAKSALVFGSQISTCQDASEPGIPAKTRRPQSGVYRSTPRL